MNETLAEIGSLAFEARAAAHLRDRLAAIDKLADIARRVADAEQRERTMREALEQIQKWEIPKVFDEKEDRMVSFAVLYGSNGERDYMRAIAVAALAAVSG